MFSNIVCQVLSTSADLKTNACCTGGKPPAHILKALANVNDEVASKYYGMPTLPPRRRLLQLLYLIGASTK